MAIHDEEFLIHVTDPREWAGSSPQFGLRSQLGNKRQQEATSQEATSQEPTIQEATSQEATRQEATST